MIIYIDSDYRCHTSNPEGTYREFDVSYFDNKCTTLIEGYRYVPAGETWTRNDGETFTGEMIAPAVDYEPLGIAQLLYEAKTYDEALAVLGVTV